MRTLICVILVIAAASSSPAAEAAKRAPLSLDEVLRSVATHYPLLAAVNEERTIAAARLQSSRGAFDLQVGGGGKAKPEGYYETYEGGVFLKQPTTLWGIDLFGGYRIGTGDFAVWDGGDQTNDGGEFELGFRLPLLRDRAIDKRRAELRKADIKLAGTDPLIAENLLRFNRAASIAYWNWVETGLRVRVADQLLSVAENRQDQIARRVERGATPEIDLADNERLIVDRRVRLIAARRSFEQAAADLSLFLRDGNGGPLLAESAALPEEFPPENAPDMSKLEGEIELAFSRQPLLRKLDFRLESAEIDLRLAENQMLPEVDVQLAGSQDIGGAAKSPDDKGPGVLVAKLEFAFPVQRREARGEVAAAAAKLRQIKLERDLAQDRIAAEVRKAMAALSAAYQQLFATRKNLELSERLRAAESRKLLLGTSNLINVNIRELQAFDAASSVIESQADYFRALANYRAVLGELG